mmetsp:Transcript_14343/g.23987  ORF Transcript_14343/g.23987 Transcript_14343/m.23987 type:complete len:85 (-) Transcript_14343:579-833(-)
MGTSHHHPTPREPTTSSHGTKGHAQLISGHSASDWVRSYAPALEIGLLLCVLVLQIRGDIRIIDNPHFVQLVEDIIGGELLSSP